MDVESNTVGGEKILSFKKFQLSNNKLFSIYESQYKDYSINYTFGGHCSLLAILDDLIKTFIAPKILLPSYTCSSIITTLRLRNVEYDFYKLNNDLIIDVDDILTKCRTLQTNAILIIDYIGFNQFEHVKKLKQNYVFENVKIIQDSVHSLCINNYPIYGDYAYNSFRKILPLEGSLLLSKKPMAINFNNDINSKFLFFKRSGQFFRYFHLKFGLFNAKLILYCFGKAENYYKLDKIFRLSPLKKSIISRINLKKSYETSKKYYLRLIKKYPQQTLKSFKNENYYPLGWFMQVNSRDEIKAELSKLQIFCPIHWHLSEEINKNEFHISNQISQKSLTIPLIDIDDHKFEHIILSLNKIL